MKGFGGELSARLREAVLGDPFWQGYFEQQSDGIPSFALHLGVFQEPFLGYLLDGRKTIDARFSARRSPPYHRVAQGDVVLIKQTAGPVIGLCLVTAVWFYRLDPGSWQMIRREFAAALCAHDPEFWRAREAASFATLMRIECVRRISPFRVPKRDRRGWAVLRTRDSQAALGL